MEVMYAENAEPAVCVYGMWTSQGSSTNEIPPDRPQANCRQNRNCGLRCDFETQLKGLADAQLQMKAQFENALAEAKLELRSEFQVEVGRLQRHLRVDQSDSGSDSQREERGCDDEILRIVKREEGDKSRALMSLSARSMAEWVHRSFRISISEQLVGTEEWYNWEQSMWDAGLFLFLGGITIFDRFVLCVGLVLSIGLQVLVFFVIIYDMLDETYNESTVAEMITWRVNHGHHGPKFDALSGQSLASKLCRGKLWSFEAAEYEEMYEYLYKPVPGIVLSTVAIILWVLSTMGELRSCLEQFLAIRELPRLQRDAECICKTDAGAVKVTGITTSMRVAAIACITAPRCLVNVALTVAACQYLAQTAMLADILLNACALSFVLDIDEHLAQVLLSERLRLMVARALPLYVGKQNQSITGATTKDWARILLTVAIVLFTVCYWLLPFAENVQGAATAICGGKLDFSYTGGTDLNPDLTLMPHVDTADGFNAVCTHELNRTYQKKYYPTYEYAVPPGVPNVSASVATSVEQDTRFNIFSYAFQPGRCPPGSVQSPPRDVMSTQVTFKKIRGAARYHDGTCEAVPLALAKAWPFDVNPGKHDVPHCPRFDIFSADNACRKREHPGVCIWSHEAQSCEGMGTPGIIFQSACQSDLWLTCDTWETMFKIRHPKLNCMIARFCTPQFPRCLLMTGWLELAVANTSSFADNVTALEMLLPHIFEASSGIAVPWASASFRVHLFDGFQLSAWPCSAYTMLASCMEQHPQYCYWTGSSCAQTTTSTTRVWTMHQVDGPPNARCGGPAPNGWKSLNPWPSDVMFTPITEEECKEACRSHASCSFAAYEPESGGCTEYHECNDLKITNKAFTLFARRACSWHLNYSACPAECHWANSTCEEPSRSASLSSPSPIPKTTPGLELCIDSDYGALDVNSNACVYYTEFPNTCADAAENDDKDFSSAIMCCACGGGILQVGAGGCANSNVSCLMVFYALSGMSEELLPETILEAGASLAAALNENFSNYSYWGPDHAVLNATFNDSSVRFSRRLL